MLLPGTLPLQFKKVYFGHLLYEPSEQEALLIERFTLSGSKMPDPDQSSRTFRNSATQFIRARFERGVPYGIGFTISALLVIIASWFFYRITADVFDQDGFYLLDAYVQDFFQSVANPQLTVWVRRITRIGGYPIITILIAVTTLTVILFRRWWLFFKFVPAVIFGGLLNETIKLVFERERPTELASGYSYPSGHAFISMVFFGFLIHLVWQIELARVWRIVITIVCVFLILAIGLSRIYLNVHWTTDVLAGYFGGLLWLSSTLLVVRIVEHTRKRRTPGQL